MKTKLAVFDFDDTIKERYIATKDSMLVLLTKLFPDPKKVEQIWNELKNNVTATHTLWEVLNKNADASKSELIEIIENDGRLVNGMDKVLEKLSYDHDIIIVSHNDCALISPFLAKYNLMEFIKEVFAKPIIINDEGKFVNKAGLNMGFIPENWSGYCGSELSSPFCKTAVLKSYLKDNHEYESIIYFGDGANDLCPALSLCPNDIICPRQGFPLEDLLKSDPSKAQLVSWNDGSDILKCENIFA